MNLLKKTLLTSLACFIMIMALVFVVTGSTLHAMIGVSLVLLTLVGWVAREIVRWWDDVREGGK